MTVDSPPPLPESSGGTQHPRPSHTSLDLWRSHPRSCSSCSSHRSCRLCLSSVCQRCPGLLFAVAEFLTWSDRSKLLFELSKGILKAEIGEDEKAVFVSSRLLHEHLIVVPAVSTRCLPSVKKFFADRSALAVKALRPLPSTSTRRMTGQLQVIGIFENLEHANTAAIASSADYKGEAAADACALPVKPESPSPQLQPALFEDQGSGLRTPQTPPTPPVDEDDTEAEGSGSGCCYGSGLSSSEEGSEGPEVLQVSAEHGAVLTRLPGIGVRTFVVDRICDTIQGLELPLSVPCDLAVDVVNGSSSLVVLYGDREVKRRAMESVCRRAAAEILSLSAVRENGIGMSRIATSLLVRSAEVCGEGVLDLLVDPAAGDEPTLYKPSLDALALPTQSVKVTDARELPGIMRRIQETRTKLSQAPSTAAPVDRHFIVELEVKLLRRKTGVESTSRIVVCDVTAVEKKQLTAPLSESAETNANDAAAIQVNLGLLALKKCIRAAPERRKVPVNDSPLTQLIGATCFGHSIAVLICGDCSPGATSRQAEICVNALRFGEQCTGVTPQSAARARRVVKEAFGAVTAELVSRRPRRRLSPRSSADFTIEMCFDTASSAAPENNQRHSSSSSSQFVLMEHSQNTSTPFQ